mmetsp:Transcript_31247/g.27613  ORF Transcript_31247/g.27613 Transcript_31247/m.27613 type:complete len:184 (-) Transcript_31247:372-923(-)|eukprot:CAMPEP_0205805072 /NCGR_PEP_ID=MMETSP0205-20121125/8174_1 /ASSEMBLY_ACC=CAM_ASM_000278 /TAXON_ID=36767 /ORGANISM="Euplotes focardii, Strain TN1" /LENGTH=183 /DNA_ID=CAMNT_0053075681 /DNA_START=599 /DNA_END=1150 /DNA_ORIENTATION=+
MPFIEFYENLVLDMKARYQSILCNLFPVLSIKNLIEPFKSHQKNIDEAWVKLRKFLKESEDGGSVYRKMLEYGIGEEDALHDMIGLLLGGHDTSSQVLISAVYFTKKNPEVHAKLLGELTKLGIDGNSDYRTDETKDAIQECEYLDYVVKEILRIDCPTLYSLPYKTLEKVSIRNVEIPKGQR